MPTPLRVPSPLRGEILAIGDELTTGQRLDTNTRWLAERLTGLGVQVRFHTTVGDDLDANVAAFRTAAERADVAVCTGGLGPTADDLTRDALAAAAGVALVDNAEALAHIESIFSSRGREMPPRNALQARFPQGAEPIHNPNGTAPGVDFTLARQDGQSCRFFALPGVPSEMRPMWDDAVAPAIEALAPGRVTRHYLVKCYGVGESQLEAMLPEMIARQREPLVGITASQTTLTLRVTASADNEAACYGAMGPTLDEIRSTLGDLVFAEARGGEAEPDLEDAVVRMLKDRGECLATAEAMTSGGLARRLGGADPEGAAYIGGESRPRLASEEESQRTQHDATECRVRRGADWAIAIGAAVDAREAPVAIASTAGVKPYSVKLYGPAEHLPARVAKQSLNLLRLTLLREARGENR